MFPLTHTTRQNRPISDLRLTLTDLPNGMAVKVNLRSGIGRLVLIVKVGGSFDPENLFERREPQS